MEQRGPTVINIIITLVITFMYGIYNYIPKTNNVHYGIQCCSCSVFTVCATCNVISPVNMFIIIIISSSSSGSSGACSHIYARYLQLTKINHVAWLYYYYYYYYY